MPKTCAVVAAAALLAGASLAQAADAADDGASTSRNSGPGSFKTKVVRSEKADARLQRSGPENIHVPVDARTGEVRRLTREEARRAAETLAPELSRTGGAVRVDPRGVRVADLAEGFQHVHVLQVNADGTRSTVCTDSLEGLVDALSAAPAVRPAALEEK